MKKRWVYGTKTKRWYHVDSTDRDFENGITDEEMERIGKAEAKSKYLQNNILN